MFAGNPALVLNADFQPLSYFPLSLFGWEDSVKAVVKGSPRRRRRIRPGGAEPVDHDAAAVGHCAARVRAAAEPGRVHPVQCFPAGLLRLPVLQRAAPSKRSHFRPRSARAAGGVTSWENIATACSPCNTRKDKRIVKPKRKPFEPTVHQLMAAQRHFPPNFLHETWRDYLYWDVELEK